MEITVFAKKRTTRDGKKFYSYLATLTKKDGTEQIVSVKFRSDADVPKPDDCPINIIVEKSDANLSTKKYVVPDTGEVINTFTLWVKKFTYGDKYVDHSLDEFI